ncbi:hypothetical protein BME99_20075 [Pseudomonas protegens]|nr:hypothetical protein BME99_20075 [Pseudomonas protegens]
MHLKALDVEFLGAGSGQLQAQFPGEQPKAFGFGLEGFMQALGAILRRGFAPGPGFQGVEVVQLFAQLGALFEERDQGLFMRVLIDCHEDSRKKRHARAQD